MKHAEMLTEVGRLIGCPHWASDSAGACALAFEDGLRLELLASPGRDAVQVAIALGRVVPASRTETLAAMLLANRGLGERGEPWFAFEPVAGTAHLCAVLTLGAGIPARVASTLVGLVATAREYRSNFLREGYLAA